MPPTDDLSSSEPRLPQAARKSATRRPRRAWPSDPPDSPGLAQTPGAPFAGLASRALCRIVRQVTAEMLALTRDRVQLRRDSRRNSCHVRQIAMYVCHVVLRLSLTDIGLAFGRDRTTVSHACHVVEDRRDDQTFDDFVSAVERTVVSVFGAGGGQGDA